MSNHPLTRFHHFITTQIGLASMFQSFVASMLRMKIRNLWEIEDRNWYNRVRFNVQNRNVLYLIILKIVNQNNNLLTTMIFDDPTTNYSRSVDDICIPIITRFDLLIFMFKDLNKFKHRIFRQNDVKNYHLARNVKCRFCDFFGSQRTVQNNEA